MMGATILLVEDDPVMARSLSKALESSGHQVTAAGTGSEARSRIDAALRPDLIILDLILPDTDGLLLASAFKQRTDAAIIICSGRHEQVDKVLGLKLGADDFIVKPFELDELDARIDAVLRRARRARMVRPVPSDQIRIGELLISQSRRTAVLASRFLPLTPTEYRLLVALAARAGEVLSRQILGQLVWGYDDSGTGHLIDVHIGRLRLKLRRATSAGQMIMTVRGKGYTLVTETPHPSAEDNGETRSPATNEAPKTRR